ncbi:hypothetical protein Pmani_022248 [Petrolisthes manimaculis]|uniref:Major facilitator superfamily (MFS) profile domain-containing protein n=1 Tax=Petrolisthes manimaculis TaxID=1843537 RepID=A0AAE1U4G1_9EUCA|nr:hypothetical protein Pmani_022248 [Petrolisthes manimaculis]
MSGKKKKKIRDATLHPKQGGRLLQPLAAATGVWGFGVLLGYTSSAGPQIMSSVEEGGLDMTTEQYSWFSSCFNLGAMGGSILAALGMKRIGSRWTMIAAAPLFFAGILAIALGWSYWVLMCGRTLAGVAVGVVTTASPPYIAEVASPHIRGALGTFVPLMIPSGVLIMYSMGWVLEWRWLAIVCVLPNLIHLLLLVFASTKLPSTLVSQGKLKEALVVLQYLRGENHDVQGEMEELEKLQMAREKMRVMEALREPHVLKPLVLVVMLMTLLNASGIQAIQLNIVTIFKVSGTGLSEDLSATITGVVQVLGAVVMGALLDKMGRRRILLCGMPCIIVALACLGLYFYLWGGEQGVPEGVVRWLPLASLLLYFISFNFSLGGVSWVMMGEFFSPEISEVATPIVSFFYWLSSFIFSYIFFPLRGLVGDAGMFWVFSAIQFVGWILIIILIPETKGKTLHQISAHFGKGNNNKHNNNNNTTTKEKVVGKSRGGSDVEAAASGKSQTYL